MVATADDKLGRMAIDTPLAVWHPAASAWPHRDGNRLNNDPSNIEFLCKRHHNAAHKLLDGHVGGGPRPRVNALRTDRARTNATALRPMLDAGASIEDAATRFGVHTGTVYRWLRKYPKPLDTIGA